MIRENIQLFETLLVVILYILVYFLTKTIINNTLKKTTLQRGRRKIIINSVLIFNTIAFIILIAGIWGLEQKEIAVFASTILTALGIAFFAHWSLLSNITSSIILFFNHPIKLGDTIRVLDKDFPFEGEVKELTYFFVVLESINGDVITIPNSLLFQKSISLKEKQPK